MTVREKAKKSSQRIERSDEYKKGAVKLSAFQLRRLRAVTNYHLITGPHCAASTDTSVVQFAGLVGISCANKMRMFLSITCTTI